MRIEVVPVQELGASEISRWRVLQLLHPPLNNPHFTPEYAQVVARARPDARVAVIEDERGVQGFLTTQRQRPGGCETMPLGAPVGDYQGVVGTLACDAPLSELCRALGAGRLDFSRALADQPIFSNHAKGSEASWIADIGSGSAAYFTGLKVRRPQFFYQLSRTRRKIGRERGELAFASASRNVA